MTSLLQNRKLVDQMKLRASVELKDDEPMTGIENGTRYREKLAKDGFDQVGHNIVLSFTTDGVCPFNNSAYTMWPVMISVRPCNFFFMYSTRVRALTFFFVCPANRWKTCRWACATITATCCCQ